MVLEPRARTQAKSNLDDTNSKIAATVKLITKYGPQINMISRELGIHKETVRYWYRHVLLGKGYVAQAVPNHEKLGLVRMVALAEFSKEFRPYADAILMAMSELSYLGSFMKTLPEDMYSIQASVPKEQSENWARFMFALKQRGLFNSIRVFPFDWVRVVPMRADMYDFENDSWQYDWNAKPKADSTNYIPSEKGEFDFTDLSIIKQLQMDPDSTLVEIAKELKLNYKTLSWHYRSHVIGNDLLKGYSVNWAGTRYDPKVGKALHRRHRYMWLELLVSNLTESERLELMANISRLPFVWLEAGSRNYFAQIAFPMETMTEALEFIKEVVAPVKEKSSWHFMDQANALRFSIALSLYDKENRQWMFDKAELLSKFDKLVLEIKGMTS